ncbi:FtsJ-domain-containing protein [Tothia fuscella]|uniref:rRNA methyltransferase 2, mitochondrial n=1 Tax=Tothia fuscella TaxID=1048955 RepID=A0A9P4P473_9PEZI|nr:FtsJ-domain-containing protein [Tothia fuscella]
MLTRRLIREFTDFALFGHPLKPQCLPSITRHKLLTSHLNRSAIPTSQYRGQIRNGSSSTRWKSRATRDTYSKEAKVQGLKSRAAFKLLEINEKYKFFKAGQTVVDLGYAPGSWSQVAVAKTAPNGRVVGIDILPVQPPKGVSTIQGNFLSAEVQKEVRAYVQDPARGRVRTRTISSPSETVEEQDLDELGKGYIDIERSAHLDTTTDDGLVTGRGAQEGGSMGGLVKGTGHLTVQGRDEAEGRVVDVVLSDMCAPWEQTTANWIKSVSNPYNRMMNTSGIGFRDHVGSMDLCLAALTFSFDTLRTGGHFVCKFYQGAEDKVFELRLRKLFEKVNREKPDSSRSESKEGFFVALRRKEGVAREDVLHD